MSASRSSGVVASTRSNQVYRDLTIAVDAKSSARRYGDELNERLKKLIKFYFSSATPETPAVILIEDVGKSYEEVAYRSAYEGNDRGSGRAFCCCHFFVGILTLGVIALVALTTVYFFHWK